MYNLGGGVGSRGQNINVCPEAPEEVDLALTKVQTLGLVHTNLRKLFWAILVVV